MFHSLRTLFAPRTPRTRPSRSARLGVTALERRDVMSTAIYLDFNGITGAEIASLNRAVSSGVHSSATGHPSYIGEFATLQTQYGGFARYNWLDFNADNQLSAADGEIAAGLVLARVQQDFAPYDVAVIRMDRTADYILAMRNSSSEDAAMVVSGAHDNPGGEAPVDAENRQDNAMGGGGSVGLARWMADWSPDEVPTGAERREAFLNAMANIISHEAGHSFGLEHVVVVPNATHEVGLMRTYWAEQNDGFMNSAFPVEGGGTQNAHQYLTRILGSSRNAWAAILTPGTLTVQGSVDGDQLSVTGQPDGTWRVNIVGTLGLNPNSYVVDPRSKLNPAALHGYLTPITSVVARGGNGNDRIEVAVNGVTTFIHGDYGHDLLIGGGGSDYLYGGWGADILVGNGGNDYLYGNEERDILIGGSGTDYLYGGTGEDVLIGEHSSITNNVTELYNLRNDWSGAGAHDSRQLAVKQRLGRFSVSDYAWDLLSGDGDKDLFFTGPWDNLYATPDEVKYLI